MTGDDGSAPHPHDLGLEYGSDLIAELLLRHGIEVVAFNPGATFRGLHDSLVHRGSPKIVLCTHEEIAVAVGHAYAKAAGRPMAVLLHDVVGLQHATMAIYNAWVDRAPVLLLGGTGPKSTPERRPWIDWIHTASMQAEQIREYVKWDDEPADLASIPDSIERAMQIANTDPKGPVYVNFDVALQEMRLPPETPVPAVRGVPPQPPVASGADIKWVADHLRAADLPLVVTDYVGDDEDAFQLLLDVAERTGAGVIDAGDRFNFPTRHDQNVTGVPEALQRADLIVAVEVEDLYGRLGPALEVQDDGSVLPRAGTVVTHATTAHYGIRSWAHAYQRNVPITLTLSSSGGPFLEALRRELLQEPVEEDRVAARRARLASWSTAARDHWRTTAGSLEAHDAIHPGRLAYELGLMLEDRPWRVVHGSLQGWERRLWRFERPRQHLGRHGGGGLGYGPGAAVGAALAWSSESNVTLLNLQPDGDLLFTPSGLWTMAHERLPVLTVVHNNRQYENTVGHARDIAEQRGRNVADRYVGSALTDPDVAFAELARAQGVWGIGPIRSVPGLKDAVREALAITDSGSPAVVDVWTTGS